MNGVVTIDQSPSMGTPTLALDDIRGWNIYQRVHGIMSDLRSVEKTDGKNGLKYDFIAHDTVMDAVQPLLVKYRVVMVPKVTEHSREGNQTTIRMDVWFASIDQPDGHERAIVVPTVAYGIDSQDKGPGKAISYCVKYACLKLFAMKTGDDPENDDVPRNAAMMPAPKKQWEQLPGCITEAQKNALLDVAKKAGKITGIQLTEHLKFGYGIRSFSEIRLTDIRAIEKFATTGQEEIAFE